MSVLPLVDLTLVLGSEEVSMRKSEAFLAWGVRNGMVCMSSWMFGELQVIRYCYR